MADVMLGAPLAEAIGHFRDAFHRYSALTATVPEPRCTLTLCFCHFDPADGT